MQHISIRTLLAFATATALLAGCTKDNTTQGGNATPGREVSVTMPFTVSGVEPASAATDTPTAPMSKSALGATPRSAASASEGFTVSFDEPEQGTTAAATASSAQTTASARGTDASSASGPQSAPEIPATRAPETALSNVWVLQFNASGTNVKTTNVGSLAAGAYLAPALLTGTGYTVCIVANGPASGLSTSNPATLADFEAKMLHTAAVTSASALPLSGKLTGVTVVDLGDGKGAIRQLGDASAAIVLRRIHAEVTLAVDFAVTGYTLTGAELYNVPVGATYGWNNATTTFPANTVAANFAYTSTAAAGMAPLTTVTDGTKKIYKWFPGDNRRGEVTSLTAQSDRNSAKAPAYATFARVTLTSTTSSTQKIFYDVYFGSGALTNFDMLRNHTYTLTAAIKGSADFQEELIGSDARVSGVNIPIWLTDSKADSPFLISPKSMESTSPMVWGPEIVTGIADVYDGKGNTDKIMALGTASQHLAAQHCRKQGSVWNLPAQAQLQQMWIYLPAIPTADRPASGNFWPSTECGDGSSGLYAWYVRFSDGFMTSQTKDVTYYVRCVRDGANPTFGSWKYPKVESGNTITSRDAAGGIKSDGLLTAAQKTFLMNQSTQPIYSETSEYNKVSAKFEVASADASTATTWADAYAKCKSYSQSSAAAGSWRLPTQRELLLIWMFKTKLTGCGTIITTTNSYRSGTESSSYSSGTWYVGFQRGYVNTTLKESSGTYVRCVRDL